MLLWWEERESDTETELRSLGTIPAMILSVAFGAKWQGKSQERLSTLIMKMVSLLGTSMEM